MKVCSKCREDKPLDGFYKNRAQRDGLSNYCKPCQKGAVDAWYEVNRERDLAKGREWYAANSAKVCQRTKQWKQDNPERRALMDKAWREANSDKTREYEQRWTEKNRHKVNAKVAKRRAVKTQRTINLSPEHELAIKRLYAFAQYITEKTKIPHHVDHIVPLQGKEMTGLHVPWNLQVIAASTNLAKSNKLDYSRALPTCMDRADARN